MNEWKAFFPNQPSERSFKKSRSEADVLVPSLNTLVAVFEFGYRENLTP